jgi:hypothetical protein
MLSTHACSDRQYFFEAKRDPSVVPRVLIESI